MKRNVIYPIDLKLKYTHIVFFGKKKNIHPWGGGKKICSARVVRHNFGHSVQNSDIYLVKL